jgi:hypothetical protein
MHTDLDDTTADEAIAITAINNEFARVHYTRPLAAARRTSRPAMLIAGGLAAASIAVIAIVAVVAVSPADRPAFGWTAEARTATADENATALQLCDTTRIQQGDMTSFSANDTGAPNMTLQELDLRGDFAVATLFDDAFAKVCVINISSGTWTAGDSLVFDREGPPQLNANSVTAVLSGATIVFGWVPDGIDSVRIDVPGVPSFTVPAANGMFATWAPITVAPNTGTITAFGPDGTVVATAPIQQFGLPA